METLKKKNLAYWAKILKGLYFPNCSFLEAVRGSKASWVWLSLLHGRETLIEGLRWQVQSGDGIKFWNDKWVPSLAGFKLSSSKRIGCDIEWVSDVIKKDKGVWDKDKIKQLVIEEEWKAISLIPVSCFKREDSLVWHFLSDGNYSVKSGYRIAFKNRHQKIDCQPSSSFTPNKNIWSMIWKLEVPHKVLHFWWRACSNSLEFGA